MMKKEGSSWGRSSCSRRPGGHLVHHDRLRIDCDNSSLSATRSEWLMLSQRPSSRPKLLPKGENLVLVLIPPQTECDGILQTPL